MSKGTKVYAVRLPQELVVLVNETISRRNLWTIEAEWTLSDFVRVALMEKIAKMERSRRPRGDAGPQTIEDILPPVMQELFQRDDFQE